MVERIGLFCDCDNHTVVLHTKGATQISWIGGVLGHDHDTIMEQGEMDPARLPSQDDSPFEFIFIEKPEALIGGHLYADVRLFR